MRTYITYYQESHDIDWFFQYKGRYFHVASNGGKIPDKIDSSINREIQHLLESEPGINSHIQIANNPDNLDYSTFFEYAEKGFISIDRNDGPFEEQNYYVVAIPSDFVIPSPSVTDKIPEIEPFENGMNIVDINRFLEE